MDKRPQRQPLTFPAFDSGLSFVSAVFSVRLRRFALNFRFSVREPEIRPVTVAIVLSPSSA